MTRRDRYINEIIAEMLSQSDVLVPPHKLMADHADSIKIERTPCLSNTTMINKEINKSAVHVAIHAPQGQDIN